MSMGQEVIAKRYAVALFELGKEKQRLNELEDEMKTVQSVFNNQPKLEEMLTHPNISVQDKKKLIDESFRAAVSKDVLHTMKYMIDRHRGDVINEVASLFVNLAYEEKGVAEAKVYSVKPLSDDEKQALSDSFAKKVGKRSLLIDNIVDKELIGGVKLRIGNRLFDGSVSGKLKRIERQLISTKG